MRNTSSKNRLKISGEDPYSISISDLMAGLLSIFILTLVYYMINFSQATAQLTQNDYKRAEILQLIKQELQIKGLVVKVDPSLGVLHLPEGILFDVGHAEIKERGSVIIRELGQVIYNVLNSPKYKSSVETVFVEGHTDNVPIRSIQFPSNWELSTQRAINTWSTLIEAEPRLAELRNRKGENLFSCSGYADTRPVKPNTTESGRQENRRIDFRFTMTPPTPKEANIISIIKSNL